MPIPLALTAYGLPHVMGYLKTMAGEAHPSPLDLGGLMDAARDLGLAGVEFPLPSGGNIKTLGAALEQRGLRVVTDFGVLVDSDNQTFRDYLKLSAAIGATVVRATLSTILCGERRRLAGGWDARLKATAHWLNQVLPYAQDLGICVAVENHQDATTNDLLHLAEMVHHSPAYGITLDTGNPLSVGEGPVEAARQLAPWIRHLHLKDYTIHFAPEGYRLVRCAAGEGVVDFPAILEIVRQNGHDLLPGIEIAAQATRTIPLLEEAWWAAYPPRPAEHLLPALRLLWTKGRSPAEPYSSAWEVGGNSAAVSAEEWERVQGSVQYLKTILIER